MGLRTPFLSRYCRGCGRKRHETSLPTIVGLCTSCQSLVDRLRQNDEIRAVFLFRRGKQTKFYAALRGPGS